MVGGTVDDQGRPLAFADLIEKMTCSRHVKACGMILRPRPGLRRRGIRFPTASAVGYCLAPFGLEMEGAAKLTNLTCLTGYLPRSLRTACADTSRATRRMS